MSQNSKRWTSRIFVMLFLCTLIPLAQIIPEETAWENGLLECIQIAILCTGLFFSWVAWNAHRQKQTFNANKITALRHLALIAMPVWLLCIGREISWGATLFTQAVMDNEGPSFSAKLLWYYGAIKPMVLAVLVMVSLAFAYWRLDRPLVILVRQRFFPWIDFSLVVAGGLCAYAAEKNFFTGVFGQNSFYLKAEELGEILCYFALVLFQSNVFHSLRALQIRS